MSALRQLALVALMSAAFGCDSPQPPKPQPQPQPPAVDAKPVAESLPDFGKFAPTQLERLNALGFVTSGNFKHELQMTGSPATTLVEVLSVDVVRKGRSEGPHDVLDQAQRAKDNRTLAAYRRKHGDPLATFEPTHKYTVPQIAARTVFVIHLDLKYLPRQGTWVLFRCNARVKSAKGLEDKDIALDRDVVGQGYVAWRLEDLERLF
jgi:hypothetical protein